VAIKQKAINAFFGWFPILPQKTQDARAENVQERVKLGSILIMAAEPVGGGCRVRCAGGGAGSQAADRETEKLET
jgi:hypothetical protein